MILRLQTEQGLLLQQPAISKHIYDFYISLMGTDEPQRARLREDAWLPAQKVLESENEELGLAFLPKEIDEALQSMKTDTAPGPDGWPVAMFKHFWPLLREPIFALCNGFMRGFVDIARLNFGVLSLIPKVPGADNIRQYRPIALINVPFKICAKGCATRLTPIAHRTISRSQSAFIRGRNILEGPLALQETLHELRRTREPAILLKLDFEKAYDRVNWDFLRQILLTRGFSPVWVHRIMQLVSGGQTAVSVNGEVGHFFRNKRGLRQGDPISPLLFNFVADALATLLRKATEAGHIKGVLGHLIPGGISHLQYADDTLLLFQPDLHSVATIKALLISFELMSGLKINFHKCEVMPMGLEPSDSRRIADQLNCKLGKLPFTYLGLPLDAKRITIDGWAPLWTKVGGRVCPWRGKFLSSAARLVLTNASLSSLPQFAMGLFLLAEGVHAKMDTPRSRFFWEGAGPKRKYHMVRWDLVCRPKDLGGLGITNTRILNIALMCKWIWKLSQGAIDLWVDMLRNKYFPNGNFFEGRARGSPFWNDLQAVRPAFALGAKFVVGDGRSARFWLDLWLGANPLWAQFQDLYALAVNPEMTVATALASNPPAIHFRRELTGLEQARFEELLGLTQSATLSTSADTVTWALTTSGKFTVKSLYRRLCQVQGPAFLMPTGLWNARIPLKVKVFFWQLFCNTLPTSANVAKRNGPSSGLCAICNTMEDANHVFFRCPLARFAWSAVRAATNTNWDPRSAADLAAIVASTMGGSKRVLWSCLGALAWAMWLTRNKIAIEGIFPSHPANILYKCNILMQQWSPLAKHKDADKMKQAQDRLRQVYVLAREPPAASTT